MNDQQQSRADALTEAQRKALETAVNVLNINWEHETANELWEAFTAPVSQPAQADTIQCQAHSGPDCTECGGTGIWPAQADARAPWPMLAPLHLEAIVFAYNEGYSKAYDGRSFPNPFAESGSQAAAWVLGTRDGNEARVRSEQPPAQADARVGLTDEPSLTNPLTPYGMLVRALRIVTGTVLGDMAQHLGCSPAALSAVEFGRKPLTAAMVADTAAYFASVGIPDTLHALSAAWRAHALLQGANHAE
ncbi:hypothetical protein KTE23_26035 [Burkholderia multivorans]|uniref:hypothetical protein n=1 Tax=Burkholderia multivorans TaxID=87883 RepID=UPI001C2258FA|nr:hypothetical protein [Burkholderia multivorans]MBU9420029.1 hypothetical protein [Burkholderia multivorans]